MTLISWRKSRQRLERQWRSMFMNGWDSALIGNRQNPYYRRDFRRAWQAGYDQCMANEALPTWFSEWRND